MIEKIDKTENIKNMEDLKDKALNKQALENVLIKQETESADNTYSDDENLNAETVEGTKLENENEDNVCSDNENINVATVEDGIKQENESADNTYPDNEKLNAEIVEDEVFKNKKYVKFKLKDFEGPLDLLYTLIKENKVEIEDIFISDITREYLDIVTEADFADVEYAGEFVVMAATLLEIKSKKLLPVVPTDDENEVDPDYDEKMLIRQVKEYKLFKETSEKLAENETLYQFTKEPMFNENDYRVTITNFNLDKLVNAFAQIVNRAEINEEISKPRKIVKERFTVANRVKHISEEILEKKEVNFSDLYEEDFSKLEIINTFLAILELLKRQYILANQEEKFGDIQLKLREGIEKVVDEETVVDEY